MRKRWIGLLACLVIGQTQAASFDCGKAGTKVEKLICADQELSKLDEDLASAYGSALAQADKPDTLKQAQKTWLKLRNTCTDQTCIKRAYESRLQAITITPTHLVSSLPESPDGIPLSSSFVPNADCLKPLNAEIHRRCYPPEMAKLETELARVYATALSGKEADQVKKDQQVWVRERNDCAKAYIPALCLDYAYRKRIVRLRASPPPEISGSTQTGKPKGEFFLSRNYDTGASFCQDFTRNLNQFRHLDFGECNPRLSPKFPEFSRPKWEEIPFDLGIAERVVKGAINSAFSDAYLKKWQVASESLRQAGKIRLWRLRIDIDGDGKMDTIIRMDPSPGDVASPLPKKPSSPYGCDYNFGSLYMFADPTTNPKTADQFNGKYFQDIIHNTVDGIDYLVLWSPDSQAMGFWNPADDTAEIGATGGVSLANLRQDTSRTGDMCKIDWVPTGRYKPPKRPIHH